MSMKTLTQQMLAVVLPLDGDKQAMYREGRAFLLNHGGEEGFGDAVREFARTLDLQTSRDEEISP